MSYKDNTGTSVVRMTDGAVIPFDNYNADYQEYLAWVAGGNVAPPPPADPPPLDMSDLDNQERAIRVALLVAAHWTGRTPLQAKNAFKIAWDLLP